VRKNRNIIAAVFARVRTLSLSVLFGVAATALIAGWTPNRAGGGNPGSDLGMDPRAAKIEEVYGSKNVYVDQEENYRVRIKEGAYWPITYQWDMGDGTKTVGNNVVQKYDRPGRYEVVVRVRNPYGADSTRFWINVLNKVPAAAVSGNAGDGAGTADRDSRDSFARERAATGDTDRPDGAYFSWVLETHLTRLAADNAARKYANMYLDEVRVFVDASGPGSVAYRVVAGNFLSERSALAAKAEIEKKSDRHPSLMKVRK